MREFGEVRFRYFGDLAIAQSYAGLARVELGKLKSDMQKGELQQNSRTKVLPDGTVLSVSSIFGQDEISITTPRGTRGVSSKVTAESAPPSTTYWAFQLPRFSGTSLSVFSTRTFFGTTYGFSVVDKKIVPVVGDVQRKAQLEVIRRVIGADQFEYAVELLNSMDGPSGSYLDAALFSNSSFLVDPAIYAGKTYEAQVLALVQPYLSAFAHPAGPPVTPGVAMPAEYTRVYHPFNVQYLDVFYVLDGPPDNPRRILWNTALKNAGTALLDNTQATSPNTGIQPEYPGFDDEPVGREIVHELIGRATVNVFTFSDRSTADYMYIAKEALFRNYFTVQSNTGTGFTAVLKDIQGAGPYGRTNGAMTAVARREKYVRTAAGWQTVIADSIAPEVFLEFTKDANDPPNNIVPPPSSAEIPLYAEDVFGVMTKRGTVTYSDSEIEYEILPSPGPKAVGPQPPRAQDGARPVELTNSQSWSIENFYPTKTVTATPPPPECVDIEHAGTRLIKRYDTGQLEVVDDGNLIFAHDGTGVHATYTPPYAVTMEWSQNTAATLADCLSNSRATVRLNIYKPAYVERRAIAPPTVAGLFCVYYVPEDRMLFATLKNPASLTAFNNARLTYLLALAQSPGTAAAAAATMLSFLDIRLNDGLPEELIAIVLITGNAATLVM